MDNGERAEMCVKVGDTVIYTRYGGNEVKHEGNEYLIIEESSLLAVLDGD